MYRFLFVLCITHIVKKVVQFIIIKDSAESVHFKRSVDVKTKVILY